MCRSSLNIETSNKHLYKPADVLDFNQITEKIIRRLIGCETRNKSLLSFCFLAVSALIAEKRDFTLTGAAELN